MAPAVKRLLPPLSASDARSNISTRAPDSRAAKAAQNAAFPAPTTITSNSGEDMECEIPGQVISEGGRLRSRLIDPLMPSSPFAQKSVAERALALMGMPVTTVGRRRIAVDLEQDEYRGVGLSQRASCLGKIGLVGHFVRDRNPAAAGDNPQIDALAGMRGLT